MAAVTDAEAAVQANLERWFRFDRPSYRGIYCQQIETDLDRYAELIAELRPPFIAEIGRAEGGTTLYLADRLAEVNPCGVLVSIDVLPPDHPGTARVPVDYITADSLSNDAVAAVWDVCRGRRGLVLLDGDHSSAQVLAELDLYADMAAYFVVEDTIMRHLGDQDGPHRALDAWLPNHPEFTPDPDPAPTQHPGGWLRRT